MDAIVTELFECDSDSDDEDCESKRAQRKREGQQKDKVRDIDWAEVAARIGNGRKSAECMRRYNKVSGIRGGEKAAAIKGPWTAEEDKKIMDLVKANGAKRWSQIAAELPGKYLMKPHFGFLITSCSPLCKKAVLENNVESAGTIT